MLRTLKPTLFIAPVIALAIAGNWIVMQRKSISTLEKESVLLQKHISETRSAIANGRSAESMSGNAKKALKEDAPINWKQLADQFADMQNGRGMGDMRSMMRLQKRLMEMDAQQLVAALDEIAALDLTHEARTMLEHMLIEPLAKKEPELALNQFCSKLQNDGGGLNWQLSNAFKTWAGKDLAKATSWFDQQIAAGTFDSKSLDGKSQPRMQFEGVLISALLSTDPDFAARRLGTIPEEQRSDVLNNYSFRSFEDAAFASLVRDQLPENEQTRVIAQQVSRYINGEDYANVSEYIDRIDASPGEKAACVKQAAESKFQQLPHQRKVTREDFDSLRDWANTQAPETTDRALGNAISNSMRGEHALEFSEAADIAREYHQDSSGDDVLVSFLDSWQARQHREEARALADDISDEKQRERILKNLQ